MENHELNVMWLIVEDQIVRGIREGTRRGRESFCLDGRRGRRERKSVGRQCGPSGRARELESSRMVIVW